MGFGGAANVRRKYAGDRERGGRHDEVESGGPARNGSAGDLRKESRVVWVWAGGRARARFVVSEHV